MQFAVDEYLKCLSPHSVQAKYCGGAESFPRLLLGDYTVGAMSAVLQDLRTTRMNISKVIGDCDSK